MVKALFDTNLLIDFLKGNAEADPELRRFPEGAISLVTFSPAPPTTRRRRF